MIFQDPYASLNPRKRVGQIVGDPLRLQGVASGSELRARCRSLLERVGLAPEHYDRFPHEFSGGQRQRIGIARAIALQPKLIVADEPVSALDVSIQAQIINLLDDLQDELGLTYVFVAHDIGVVRHVSDRIAVMHDGKIVEEGHRRPGLRAAPRRLHEETARRGADTRSARGPGPTPGTGPRIAPSRQTVGIDDPPARATDQAAAGADPQRAAASARSGPTSRSSTASARSSSSTARTSYIQSRGGKELARYFPELSFPRRGATCSTASW